MHPIPEVTSRCPVTGILHRWTLPRGLPEAPQAAHAVFFLNGIGLDLEGFREAMQGLEKAPPHYPYRKGYHVALTVPGFEDEKDRASRSLISMSEQGRMVATFLETFLTQHPAKEVVLYGFSFGSDLAVEVVSCLNASFPLVRVVLAEMNVHIHSCFITSRIATSYSATRGQGSARDREAYKGFVSMVVKASSEGRLSADLMQDMAEYFRTIARKDWAQLAQSAEEASENPEFRVARLLGLTADCPTIRFDLVFSDAHDLRIFQRRLETWGGTLGQVRAIDATAHGHFHHMRLGGVLENLGGWAAGFHETPSHPS